MAQDFVDITSTNAEGVTINGVLVPWDTLQSASTQEDEALAWAYSELLRRAKNIENRRLFFQDAKQYGYPLRAGYNRRYDGQIVMKAWEIRRVPGREEVHGPQLAYIVTWDRSDNSITRLASPEFAHYMQAQAWVDENYGWSSEQNYNVRTAMTYLRT